MIIDWLNGIDSWLRRPQEIQRQLDGISRSIEVLRMSISDDIRSLTAQVVKSRDEILNKIAVLEATINDQGDVASALADLRAEVQAIDDIVPDQG